MKHIRSYENINISTENIPKYMIISINDGRLLNKLYILQILEIVKDDDNENELKVIKRYTYDGNELKENEKKFTFNIRFINSILKNVYESNSLEDCIDMVNIISKSKKYNL
jgi:hypothetical protein